MAISKKVCFIINPKSGTGYWKGVEKSIATHLDKSFTATILNVERPKHGRELAREAAKTHDIIVAVGGDGMMNETAMGMMNTNALLGIIPTGSGNAMARHLGIPLSHQGAIECINKMNYQTIDSATVNGQPFFAIAGIGFDAEVAAQFALSHKRGFWTYFKLSFTNFFTYKPHEYDIIVDGKTYHEKAFLISIANSSQYGNNAYIAPTASVQDGLLNACVLKPFYWITGTVLAYRLFTKTIHTSSFLSTLQGKEIEIRNASGKPLSVHYDGETGEAANSMKFAIQPNTLKVILPEGRKI